METDNESELRSTERDLEAIEPAQTRTQYRLEALLRRAEELKIDPAMKLHYAQLLVDAEHHHAGEAASADHARRARAEIVGEMHGFPDGYAQPEEAIRRDSQGRETRQQFCRLAEAVAHRIRKAEEFFDAHIDHFTNGLRANYPRKSMAQTFVFWNRLATAANPGKTFYHRVEPTQRVASASRLALTNWRYSVPDYDGKWQHMYELARCWHVSNSQDLDSFKRYVRRITTE